MAPLCTAVRQRPISAGAGYACLSSVAPLRCLMDAGSGSYHIRSIHACGVLAVCVDDLCSARPSETVSGEFTCVYAIEPCL